MRTKILLAASLILVLIVGCTVMGRTVDAPVTLEADYAAREAEMMDARDSCGPEFVQEKLPATARRVIEPIADGPFRPVCARHDACYRLGEKTQAWCDDRMKTEMLAICDKGGSTPVYSVPGIGASLCRFQAGMYYGAINNTYGGYAYGTEAGGEITAVRTRIIDDVMSDDEFEVCVDVLNPTLGMQEYDVELHHADGRQIDREPDLHEENVRAGESEVFCVGTNFSPRWSLSDIGELLYVSVRADTPDSFAFVNDMVVVDVAEVRVAP